MSWPVGIGSPEVNLFIDLLKNLSIMLLGIFLVCKFQIIILKTTEVAETQTLLGHMYKVKILNNTFDQSSVTFMHMPNAYSYYSASLKSLS